VRNPFSEKVARALALKKVEFDRVIVSGSDEIARYSPEKRTLPVLQIGDEWRAESGVILDWIDERYPEPPLLSSDSKVAEAQRSLAEWSDSSFAFYWNRWLASQEPLDEAAATPAADGRFLERMRSSLGRSLSRGARPSRKDALELQVIDGIARRLDDLEKLLGERDFFHADQPSMADLAVFGMMLLIEHGPIPGSADMLAARPTLVAYVRRLEAATGGPYVAVA
jgi:glutathione S-transferase